MESRELSDFGSARKNLYQSFQEAVTTIPPIETDSHVLQLADVTYDDADDEDTHPEKFDYEAQTQAVYGRSTLGRRLRGTWNLVNKQTGEVEQSARQLLARVPRLNEDGTMIYRGTRYAMMNQTRVKSAIYAKRKKNEEIESATHVQTGTGSNHRYILNPETGVYYFNIGHSRIPLVDVLHTLGTDDEQIKEAWGEDIAKMNLAKSDPKAINKLYEKLVPSKYQTKDADTPTKQYQIQEAFARMRVDPWSMKRTVGVETDRIDGSTILAATKRVLNLAKGDEEADDRDHLAFQSFHSIEDLIPERVRLDKGNVQRKYLTKAARNRAIARIPNSVFQEQIESALFSSGLAVQPDYANPLDALDRATRVSKMGEGGLPSTQATPLESRDVHASQHLFIDPARTVESLKTGLDLNLAMNSRRGSDGKLYTKLRNARTGQEEYLSPEQVSEVSVGISKPGAEVDGYVGVVRQGREDFVTPDKVDYIADQPGQQLFSHASNLVPFRSAMAPHRLAMAARMLAQSLPMKNREAPLVQTAVPGTGGQQSLYSTMSQHVGAIRSKSGGVVKEVTPGSILLDTPEGPQRVSINRLQPLGSKTALRNTAVVKPGDQVEPGQLLAGSNFTNDQGEIALGVNATVAFMPWGDNFEDTFTVSESFAKRAVSEHLYRSRYTPEPEHRRSKLDFISSLPSLYSKSQLEKMDDDGVIKIGQKVTAGDPLVLAAAPKTGGGNRVHKKAGVSFKDSTLTWEHDDDGEVVDVFKDKKGETVVAVGVESPLKEGDKISSTFGDKGVVRILPDDQMVQDADGNPIDIASSDLGLISRENPGRALTAFLGKIAKKTGKPYIIEEFPDGDYNDFLKSELDKHGVKAKERVVDPVTGRKIDNVGVGVLPMLKLSHIAESKSHARGVGRYASDGSPSKGSEEGAQAKRLSNQELGALISHGAYEFIREGSLLRGQRNDEYWARYINGHDPVKPSVPFVYDKFMGYLKGMGVNPVREGTATKLMVLTDDDLDELSEGREVKNGETIDFSKGQKSIGDGLFDEAVFGEDGNRFAKFKLNEPIPHPMFEDPLRALMGVTKDQYRQILSGKSPYKDYGSGPQAFSKFLGSLNVNRELAAARSMAKDSRKTKREEAIKRIRYLRGLADREIKPSSLMVSSVPIIPPKMRPVSVLQNGTPLVDGMNLLYRDMIDADRNLKKVKSFSSDVSSDRLTVYDAVQAAYGLREPIDPEMRQKKVSGLMKRIIGSSPKQGYVQRKLLSGTVDAVGRGVVVPDSRLTMDEIGIPESQAWSMYKMPVIRELRRRNFPLGVAMKMVDEKDPAAKKVLLEQLDKRPVVASRAPVLHKFGIMAFRPRLTSGHTLVVNPLIHEGMGLDHDGDLQINTVVVALPVETYFNDLDLKTKKALEKFYAKVRVGVSNSLHSVSERETMASFSKASLPFCQDHDVFQVDLEDFPRLEDKERTSQGRCGDIHWFKAIPGTKVLAVNPKDGGVEWVPVTRWTEHHGCPVEIVHLSNGYAIYTDDDPRAVLGVDPDASLSLTTATPTQAKAKGLMVPRAARLLESDDVYEVFNADPLHPLTEEHKSQRSKVLLRSQWDLDAGFGWLVGAHVSDGWPAIVGGEPRDLVISKSYGPVREKWEQQVNRIVSEVVHVGTFERTKESAKATGGAFGGTVRACVTCRPLARLFYSLCGAGALNKRLPPWFLSTSREFRVGMLCGLFDTDAGISVTHAKGKKPQLRMSITSVSLRLLREIALLSMSLGLQAKVSFSKTTSAGNAAWILEWRSGEVQSFIKQHKRHMVDKERVRMAIETPVDTAASAYVRKEKLVITKALAALLRSKLGMPKNQKTVTPQHKTLYGALHAATTRGYMSREAAKLVTTFIDRDWICQQPDGETFLQYLDDETIVWEYIEDVEITGQAQVGYDLTVPGYENWMTVDGVFVPNTMNFHAVLGDETAREAMEKMLPSKSLLSSRDFKTPVSIPRQDHAMGLFLASTRKSDKIKRPQVFADRDAVRKALARGEIDIDTPVKVMR